MRDARPLCTGEEQNVGAWRLDRPVEQAGPPCCGEFFQAGHWRAPLCKPGWQDLQARACTCGDLGKRASYTWRPARCRLLPWNASRFCERLGARRLLFLGDSTMVQHHAQLVNSILWGGRRAHAANASGCAAQVVFVHSDTITMASLGRLNRGFPIRKVLAWTPGFDAAIIGAGAHITNDSDYEGVLQHVSRVVTRAFPKVTLIWKTLNPAGCAPDARPLAELPGAGSAAFWAAQPSLFNWRSFAGRDLLARRYFSQSAATPQLGGLFDTTPMNYRADAHPSSLGAGGVPRLGRDCLHLCHSPDGGPLGLGPQLLLHGLETGALSLGS